MPANGRCQCGCGRRTRIANRTNREYGWERGKPIRFIKGHNAFGRIVTPTMREKIAAKQRGVPRASGPEHAQWKGSKMLGNGYRMKWISKHTYRLEHRWVVEQRLGRLLTPNEVVHHINHDKLDNRIDNLIVMTRAEHTKHHKLGHTRSRR